MLYTLTAFENKYAQFCELLLLCVLPHLFDHEFSNIILGPEKLISELSHQILELGGGLDIFQ